MVDSAGEASHCYQLQRHHQQSRPSSSLFFGWDALAHVTVILYLPSCDFHVIYHSTSFKYVYTIVAVPLRVAIAEDELWLQQAIG